MSGHLEIADLRGANAGLRQRIADLQDAVAELEGEVLYLTEVSKRTKNSLQRIEHMSTIGSIAHTLATETLQDCYGPKPTSEAKPNDTQEDHPVHPEATT